MLGSVIFRSVVLSGGMLRMKSTGSPSDVTSFTGPNVKPYPCVNVRRSFTHVRFGRLAEFSSRADSITCRYRPLILYRSLSTDTKS